MKRVGEITASPAPSGGEAVRTGRNIMRIALTFEAGCDGFWLDLWLVVVMRKRPEYPVSGTNGSNPPPSSKESAANSVQVQASALMPAQLIRSPFP